MRRAGGHAILAVLVAVASAMAADDLARPVRRNQDGGNAEQLFREKVQPLLQSRCVACHGPEKVEGGLRLDSRDAALAGGNSGPALAPGRPDESLLLSAVAGTHTTLEMPPKDKLSARDVAILQEWIEAGAPWSATPPQAGARDHEPVETIGDAWTDARNPIVQLFGGERLGLWSLQRVRRPDLPKVRDASWARQKLDYFMLARFERNGSAPPAEADPRTIARRLHFDLTGLPPTPQQVREFEQSVEAKGLDEATQSLVDQLLENPRFGEHFARTWLDVVRYSDSNGFDWDEFRPPAWRFRDYVVRSFNSDKPFDQFIREQLAGDELLPGPPRTPAEQDCLIATGYLRLGPQDNSAPLFNEQDRSRAELLADVTETTAQAFLGLTFSCCRCHDHKYDPLSQVDHYRLRAFFAAMRFANDVPLDLASDQADIRHHNQRLDEQAKPLREKLAALSDTETAERERLEGALQAIEADRHAYTHGLLMTDDADSVPATHLLFQGDHKSPRQVVEPGFLTVFDPRPATILKPAAATSGRRLTLANWIASPRNPLTARVLVNRVWLQLMGRPLIATPNDFGLAGSPPEDPELLDWLAGDFMDQGWSIKQLVRQLATSAAYRQVPTFTSEGFGFRLPRRLTAEQLRDSMMFVSGLLTTKADGPPIWPDLPAEVLGSNPAFLDDNKEKTKGWYPSPKQEQYCRSLFLVQKRNTRVPLLEAFDLPDNSTSCARRESSTVAPQALVLLNSSLAVEAAQAFAQRVAREVGEEPAQQVRRAFELALQRRPDKSEAAACEQLLVERSLPELCRVLLNLNEFVYLD